MSSENPEKNSKTKWPTIEARDQETLEKLGLGEIDWNRPVTPEEIQYLLAHWPFLQMVSTGGTPSLDEPQFYTAKSNWVIHLYGDAMSSSPGELLIGGGDYRVLLGEAETAGELINPGKGTIWKQAFDTAQKMIELAQQKFQWPGVNIVDGHPVMKWAAWMKAMDDGFPFEGYQPSENDYAKRERIKRSEVEDQLVLKPDSFSTSK